ncbi:MAG: hypothetical protein WCE62_20505, partial [Polyangiales bacterium]
AQGQFVGNFYVGPTGPLQIATPGEITGGAAALTPTNGVGSTVDINWDGTFSLTLTLGGDPFMLVDELGCTFDVQGAPITFPVN